MFGMINHKKIYEILSVDTKKAINIIVKNGFKDDFTKNGEKDWNCFLVFYHLLSIIYIKIKLKKGANKAEKIVKKLVYETAIRLPEDYSVEMVVGVSSGIITKFVATYRESINCTEIRFSNSLAYSICNILDKDAIFLSKEKYKKLMNELEEFIKDLMFDYEHLIK